MNKSKRNQIMSGKFSNPQDSEIYSVFIKNNKDRAKRTIQHYAKNLPTTYTVSKEVIARYKTLVDIRDSEIKNTVNVDPSVIVGKSEPIITSSDIVEKKKEFYIVPKFFPVKNHQRLQKAFDAAYTKTLRELKGRNLMTAHQIAYEKGLEALNVYADWLFKNNEMLVKKYPEYWSSERPEEKKVIEKEKPVSFFEKMKNWIKNDKG